jgi:hypothetical protein
VKQSGILLVAVVAVLSWVAGQSVVSGQGQGQTSKTLNLGDPDRPPGSDSLRAVILIPVGTATALDLTSPADGVDFDIDGDGRKERVAWTRPDAQLAFLFLDRDGDGVVKNGTELVGGAMRRDAWNGFMALGLAAPGAGGAITAEHPIFSKLLLWVDRNHDGQSQPGELRTIGEVFQKVGLGYSEPKGGQYKDAHGNVVRYQGWLLPASLPGDSRSGYSAAYDVVLQVNHDRQRGPQ